MLLYRTLLGIDALVALVVGYFFLVGLADGSVSSFNIVMWLMLIGGVGGILFGGVALHRRGRSAAGKALLALLAVPATLFAAFFGLLIVSNPRWN
jgi:hypothetical protein